MKKIICLLSICLCICTAKAQDTVTVKHEAYTTTFANSAHIPVIVTYVLHGSQLQCAAGKVKRTNNFKADPQVKNTSLGKDYDGSGYDQGHNMSAQDNVCNAQDMDECFYFTNMFPQIPKLNRGIWKGLEVQERALAVTYDSVIVFIGSYEQAGKIGDDGVVVPKYCWKVIYIPASKEWRAYSFINSNDVGPVSDGFDKYTLPATQVAWVKHCINHFTHYRY